MREFIRLVINKLNLRYERQPRDNAQDFDLKPQNMYCLEM